MQGRAVYFVAPERIEVRDRDVPTPGPDEVRVRTLTSAVSSGTERLVYRGEAPTDLPADESIAALEGDLSFPLRYGYAAVGEIEAVGDDVPSTLLGSRVFAFNPHESRFLATPGELTHIPDDVSDERAALLPTMETALNFVMDGRPLIGEHVVVFGQGVVGLMTTALLDQFPLGSLTAADCIAERRELALGLGADTAIHPESLDAPSDGADLTFELSGDPTALDDALAVTRYDGRVIVGSWYGTKPATLDLGGRFHRSRINVESSQVSTIDPDLRGRWDTERRFSLAWEYLRKLPLDSLVTHRVDVGDAARAYRLLEDNPDEAVQILFTYADG
ncbi:oxidoreductase [Haloferax mediterranei ATCC 33500]|uniref:Oxidoreductase n=1 Tax=Haloferax mediterranei (strain ATCC 33500 / DSM 1411 / JCM 8866 / NBRC 14739 / NCIMB 2177 / R-4) TaxID=523841 RepID=I3R4A0_HALMT|nr:zinc-binding alcohol dehydrogenase [Haloferax mediterranei]AFK19060.1 putative zinc-binding dehydrogenase [Haloferax mediterranei ATCC 33500]AHZ21581.1 oxidoreductase [Haloferax mediterranei ATCC 33500]EMA04045.1 putative zinc-binding dehydrogenase [Haloferax mediterranei ATCC 33500]MDX5989150.1 zinc-binding dehydrogenase [Haloferax mediterranei ATCC 33500]QCQ75533.1 oxidoreductase [Haloferax mediterranei ATCC 33500]